jgi:hypothetical protein
MLGLSAGFGLISMVAGIMVVVFVFPKFKK